MADGGWCCYILILSLRKAMWFRGNDIKANASTHLYRIKRNSRNFAFVRSFFNVVHICIRGIWQRNIQYTPHTNHIILYIYISAVECIIHVAGKHDFLPFATPRACQVIRCPDTLSLNKLCVTSQHKIAFDITPGAWNVCVSVFRFVRRAAISTPTIQLVPLILLNGNEINASWKLTTLTCRSERNQDCCEQIRGSCTASGARNNPVYCQISHDRPEKYKQKQNRIKIWIIHEWCTLLAVSMYAKRLLFGFTSTINTRISSHNIFC